MTLYVIGIGGTGSKCLEAVIQVSALGLFTKEPIKVLFIDADEANGNLERANNSLRLYQDCYKSIGHVQNCTWLQTSIESYGTWSPFGKISTNKNLTSFFNYNSLKQKNQALGNLFDILYTKKERETNLDEGFRGIPAIGSAVMSRVDLDSLKVEPWGRLIEQIHKDINSNKSPKILFCGSIFGGTGASGLPTIALLLHKKLENENVRKKVKISGLFLLPYFYFIPNSEEDTNQVSARSEMFLLNTEAALRYYANQSNQFNRVYLLGNQNFSQFKYSTGKNTQRNEPHFIELYAALAVRHFLLEPPADSEKAEIKVVLIGRKNDSKLIWDDLPKKDEVKPRFENATQFAYIWLDQMAPELATALESGIDAIKMSNPWVTKFFHSQPRRVSWGQRGGNSLPNLNDSTQQETIKIISAWCEDYLRWLYNIQSSSADDIQLFKSSALANVLPDVDGVDWDKNIVLDVLDTVRQLKDQLYRDSPNLNLNNEGTASLAKALFIFCLKYSLRTVLSF